MHTNYIEDDDEVHDFEESSESECGFENEDLESVFLKKNFEEGQMCVIAGEPGSGKTYFVLAYIKLMLFYKRYDSIYFISPTLFKEHDEQYEFMKTQKIFKLYETYTEDIINEICEKCTEERILFVFDDATATLFEKRYSKVLTKIVSTVRHGKGVSLFFIIHALKNIFLPHIRGNIGHLFVGTYNNVKLLEGIWKEHLSRKQPNVKEFIEKYNICMDDERRHNLIYIPSKTGKCDFWVSSWGMLEFGESEIEPDGKANIITISEDDATIDKIKKQRHVKQLKDKYDPKPVKEKKVRFCPVIRKPKGKLK